MFLIAGTALSCKKQNPKEKEPNSVFFNANRLEVDTTIEGFFNTDNDSDFYIIDIKSPMILDVELSAVKGVNHALKFWKDSDKQTVLKYVDDARKSSAEKFCNLFVDMGVYYIAVVFGDRDPQRANTENSYKLRVTGRVWEGEEIEPNDEPGRATLIEPGNDITGFFSPAFNKLNKDSELHFREEDWYCMNIEHNGDDPLLIDAELSGVPDVNSTLVMYNSEMEKLSSSDFGAVGEGEALRDVGIAKSGKYYLMIYSNFESNCDMPYTLAVRSRIYDHSSEVEPNNSVKTANKIVDGEIQGRIFPDRDVDFFIYASEPEERGAEAPSSLCGISLSSESGLDFQLNIYSILEKKLFEVDNFRGGEREIIHLSLPEEYYIEVGSKRGDSSDELYKLSIKSLHYSEGYEIEPNDTKESAMNVDSNRITGFINKRKDIDYYFLNYDRRVKKSFVFHGVKDATIKVSITDPLGFIIKSEALEGNESRTISEMIDLKGYIIVETEKENFEEPYIIEIGD